MGLALNLAGADTSSGFDALPSATYPCAVKKIEMQSIKGDSGTLPKGTPGFSVQFRVVGGEYDNRVLFNNYWIAPAKIDGKAYEHKKMMDGMIAKFFIAIGYDEKEVTGGDFDPDFDDIVGRECLVTVGQREYNGEVQNIVKGVRPVGTGGSSAGLV